MEIVISAITATGSWSREDVYQALVNLLGRLKSPQNLITIKVPAC
ncbi:hypothetical protein [Lacihabitans soyangensis]|nr:hypothetical protein [Lacihabitans soyangensis]